MKIVFLILLSGVVTEIQAQGGSRISLSAGLNLSTITYSDPSAEQIISPYRQTKAGLAAGVSLLHDLNPVLSLSSDVLYSRKGLSYEQETIRRGVTRLNYLQWNAAGHYRFTAGRTLNIFVGVGLYAAFWLNGSFNYTSFQSGESRTITIHFDEPDYQYNRGDAGPFVCLKLGKKKVRWIMSLSYEYGMIESAEKTADSFRNRLLRVNLEYRLF